METVEFRFRVPDDRVLDIEARHTLLDDANIEDMPSNVAQGLLPRNDMGSLYVFRVMLDNKTGIFITEDWIVRIVGPNILECVYAMCALISLIITSLDTSVSVDLITVRNENDHPLHRLLARQSRDARVKRSLWRVLTTLLTAVISGLIGVWIAIGVLGG